MTLASQALVRERDDAFGSFRELAKRIPLVILSAAKDLIARSLKTHSQRPAMRSFAYGAVSRALLRTTGELCFYPPRVHVVRRYRQIFFPLPGNPSSPHIASTLSTTAWSMWIWRPHSRLVSPGSLSVASRPIFEPRPETGEAKSR